VKSTIHTSAGVAKIESGIGVITFNGAQLLPHEAVLLAGEIERAAVKAVKEAEKISAQARLAA
jgi:hypothetical protein